MKENGGPPRHEEGAAGREGPPAFSPPGRAARGPHPIRPFDPRASLEDTARALRVSLAACGGAIDAQTLHNHGRVLDALFRALVARGFDPRAMGGVCGESVILALRAHRQFRQTADALFSARRGGPGKNKNGERTDKGT